MQRPLLLNGFMASGKSAVGKAVAALTRARFIDLDERIESAAGLKVAQIFARQGEASFRRLEAEALNQVLEETGARVVALGGGALLSRAQRLKALDQSVVVSLEATAEEVLRNAAEQPGQRPLLADPDPRLLAETLLELRAPVYAECHARLRTQGRSVEALARDAVAVWARQPVAVADGERSYAVEIGGGCALERVPEWVRGASSVLVVSDTNVAPLHARSLTEPLAARVRTELVVVPAGEANKTLQTVESIWQRALAMGADRSTRFVGLGGGVVTDLTGMAAAGWMRGVPWIGVPTTLLAMVDASVGGKTGVDLGSAKNCVGAFWQPSAVGCDASYLATEPIRGFRSALAEVVKTALIGDPELLTMLEAWPGPESTLSSDRSRLTEWVRRCVRVKSRVVGQDPREDGIRASLNLGHTLGHAFESAGGLGRLAHGEAVSLGLVAALRPRGTGGNAARSPQSADRSR
jgi:shikimate kinase / 3-dehydroquinate synthase